MKANPKILKRLKARFLKEEDGATLILVALSMVMLLGFTSLGVDYGIMANAKQSMQNAADAAALAGAYKMAENKTPAAIHAEVKSYAIKNGYDSDEENVGVATVTSGSNVTVEISKTIPLGFSMILTGRETKDLKVSATATASTIFGVYPYALFAGNTIENVDALYINGNHTTIKSPIHSNSNIRIPHATMESTATAAGTIYGISGSNCMPSMPIIPMPDYEAIRGKFRNVVTYNGNLTLKSKYTLDNFVSEMVDLSPRSESSLRTEGLTIYVNGTIICNGNQSFTNENSIPINLIAKGSIGLDGCTLSNSAQYPMVVISETGNVTLNGGGANFHGLVFVPNGDFTVNGHGGGGNIYGSVIAQNITINGGSFTVQREDDVDRFTPVAKVKLID